MHPLELPFMFWKVPTSRHCPDSKIFESSFFATHSGYSKIKISVMNTKFKAIFLIHEKVLYAVHLIFHLHHDNNSYEDNFGSLGWLDILQF